MRDQPISPVNIRSMDLATAALTSDEQKALTAFQENVIKPSMEKLVILDFWAEWCEPCKQFAPVLEKLARDYADKGVLLAKIDVDDQKFIASQFQIKSLPTVYAMFQGQPVADLTQARTEPQLTRILDELLSKLPIQAGADEAVPPEQLAAMIAAAEEALSGNQAPQAFEIYRQILTVLPENIDALSGMIRSMVALGEADKAQQMLDQLSDEQKANPAMARAQTAVNLAAESKTPDELAHLQHDYEKSPDDQAAGFAYANALFANQDPSGVSRDQAADILLKLIAADRDWNDGAARSRLLEMFETVGLSDPWTSANRRKLSAVLFG